MESNLRRQFSPRAPGIAATIANLLAYAEYYDIPSLLGPKLREAIEFCCKRLPNGLAEQIMLAIPAKTDFYLTIGEMLQSEIILSEALRHHIGRHFGTEPPKTIHEVPSLSIELNHLIPKLCQRFQEQLLTFEDTLVGLSYTECTLDTDRWLSIRPTWKHSFLGRSKEEARHFVNMLIHYRGDLAAERLARTSLRQLVVRYRGQWPLYLATFLSSELPSFRASLENEEFEVSLLELSHWVSQGSVQIQDMEALRLRFLWRAEFRIHELEALFVRAWHCSALAASQWPMATYRHVPYVTNLVIFDHEWPWTEKSKWEKGYVINEWYYDRCWGRWAD